MAEIAWQPRIAELSSPELKMRLRESDVVIIPVGAIEQHGPHLPLSTDSINIAAIAVVDALLLIFDDSPSEVRLAADVACELGVLKHRMYVQKANS